MPQRESQSQIPDQPETLTDSTITDQTPSTEIVEEIPPQTNQNPQQSELDRARSSNTEVIAVYDQVLREQAEELRRLREEVTRRNAPPPPTSDEQKQRFFNNPMDVLREEIQAGIAPILEITKGFKAQTEYDVIKNKFKNDPRYAEIFPSIESYVDQIMAKSEKTETNMRTAVLVAAGALQTGEIPRQSSNNPAPKVPVNTNTNTNQNTQVTPAHLRSTPPAPPVPDNKPKIVMTELERRLAREQRMTDEEYVRFRDMRPGDVVKETK